jgi:hypothetical protein
LCVRSRCEHSCPGSLTECSGRCTNLQSDQRNCGDCGRQCADGEVCSDGRCTLTCQGGLTNCDGACVNLRADVFNCGFCGNTCVMGQACTLGKCAATCQEDLVACSDLCTNVLTDRLNCGRCGRACASDEVCNDGTCAANCGSLTSCTTTCETEPCPRVCVDTRYDLDNCGGCGNTCGPYARATAACGGVCLALCDTNYQDCNSDLSDGCESDATRDVLNCGSCGNSCVTGPHATAACADSDCSIICDGGGYADCDGKPGTGCEATVQDDVKNCGSCGNACAADQVCSAGICVRQKVYAYTGAQQTFVVPAGVTAVAIEVWGAQGGASYCCDGSTDKDGGLGGYATGSLKVTPGETLYLYVGGQGKQQGSGGYNGGGAGGTWAAGGGGASDLRQGGSALANRVIVAGGGGGGNCGCPDHGTGGDAGGKTGSDGIAGNGNFTPGGGGKQNGGGSGGAAPGAAGSLGNGGTTSGSDYHIAGGGGGYYGGGAAYASGGGGGSSYIDNLGNASTEGGKRAGDGEIVIGW